MITSKSAIRFTLSPKLMQSCLPFVFSAVHSPPSFYAGACPHVSIRGRWFQQKSTPLDWWYLTPKRQRGNIIISCDRRRRRRSNTGRRHVKSRRAGGMASAGRSPPPSPPPPPRAIDLAARRSLPRRPSHVPREKERKPRPRGSYVTSVTSKTMLHVPRSSEFNLQ